MTKIFLEHNISAVCYAFALETLNSNMIDLTSEKYLRANRLSLILSKSKYSTAISIHTRKPNQIRHRCHFVFAAFALSMSQIS